MAGETGDGTGAATIATGTTTTVVSHYGVSSNSCVLLSPTNAAAASIDALGWWITPAKGQFTITHSNMSVARTYAYSFTTPKG